MCGIIGLLTNDDCVSRALSGLERLEYRGYDSSGLASLEGSTFDIRRAKGKLKALKALLKTEPLAGTTVIGHTRWATHGRPAKKNAHPMPVDRVCVAHNGIIDNFAILRNEVLSAGKILKSETDTEIIAFLLQMSLEQGRNAQESIRDVTSRLKGAYAFVALFSDDRDKIYMVRNGAPLAFGLDPDTGESFVGSDQFALAPLIKNIVYMEDGNWGYVSRSGYKVWNSDGQIVDCVPVPVSQGDFQISKGRHRHFMHKEIHQQPAVAIDTLQKYVTHDHKNIVTPGIDVPWQDYRDILIGGCGTALYAGNVARYWFEDLAGLSTQCEISSELRYRTLNARKDNLSIFISQSGETMDTLEALRYCKRLELTTLAICNVAHATLDREADHTLHTCAGLEVSVASTKAFSAQLMLLYLLALQAARVRGKMSQSGLSERLERVLAIPRFLADAKRCEGNVISIAKEIGEFSNALFIGRGVSYPLALEGALKLKEISYIHAEGVAAGELKHGSIALIESNTPVIAIAPPGRLFAKTMNNVQEVCARGAPVLLLSSKEGCNAAAGLVWRSIALPDVGEELSPLVYALPLHLLAYHVGVHKGTDVDQPRNLAKSVTVE